MFQQYSLCQMYEWSCNWDIGKYQFYLNLDCILCASLTFPDLPNQLCQPCVAPCLTCLNVNDCLTCVDFYEYVPAAQRCRDICGDSIVMTDQCDNGPNIFHDGCSDQCKQESDYTCVLNPDTVTGLPVQKSVCSYNL